MLELKTTIRFFQPFRIVPWIENNRHSDRNYLRGGTFAKWHMIRDNDDKVGKPYVTGTLLRSALVAEIEKISIHHSKHITCCSAIDITKNNENLSFLRKRPLYSKDKHNTSCKNCALCHILGRMDNPEKKKTYDGNHYHHWTVHFSNFISNSSFFWRDLTQERIVNRVDQTCGKAKDYFTIWEVDSIACPTLSGTIRVNDNQLSQGDVVTIKQLIAVSLAQMDTIAGAICRIDIVSEDHNQLIRNFFRNAPSKIIQPDDSKPGGERFDLANLKKLAELLANSVDMNQREQQLRRLADAVRDLRRYPPDILAKLPVGKTDGKATIWDKKVSDSFSIRDCLSKQKIPVELWRQFCEGLGKEIHTLSKNDRATVSSRLLGETDYPGRPFRKDDETLADKIILNSNALPNKKLIVAGNLIAKTPFFIGHENKSSHTSATILLNPYGQFCIPRSTIRGALRRDLRIVFGDSCNTPVGSKVCFCKVCQIMRCIKIEDAISTYKSPPEVRHRIRLNCHTGVVEEGALFDIEAGYQGMIFPFRIYYESTNDGLPHHLWEVLNYWKNGQAFLGGEAGTGFGRFELTDINVFQWEIDSDDDYLKYLFSRAYKGITTEDLKKIVDSDGLTFDNFYVKQTIKPEKIPLTKIGYTLSVDSPLISRDPIAAMLDQRNPDAVMVKKTVLTYDENQGTPKEMPRYFIKSESIRGLLRSIISRTKDPETQEKLFDLDHEDCDCVQCRLFGNVHQQGMLRFEDAEIENSDITDMKIDHVAIDRFTGGGVEKMKFNDYPLCATQNDHLILKGVIWLTTHMEETEKKALASALADLKYGYASIGGLSAIGYGRVNDLIITEGNDLIQLPAPNERCIVSKDRILLKPDVKKSLATTHFYYPHYFIQPKPEKVKRETKLVSHAQDSDTENQTLLTGKIKCRLKTLGPLFIPDTSDDHNYFELSQEEIAHKNNGFFRVKDRIAIPGASIRGMISSVYEALTHSCFRVMDDSKYLTRRVIPESETTRARKTGKFRNNNDDENKLLAGRAHYDKDEDKWYLIPMGEIVRLPLYDDLSLIETMGKHEFTKECGSYLPGLDKAIKYNRMLAKAADHNRNFLLENEDADDILKGKTEVYFTLHKQTYRTRSGIDKEINPNARYACLTDQPKGSMKGFIKYTGLDMVNVNQKNPDLNLPQFDPEWDETEPPNQFVLHNTIELRSSQKKKYPRPVLACIKDGVEYRMQKRCERIIASSNDDSTVFSIPKKVIKQYEAVLEDNKKNTETIPRLFQSKMAGSKLSEGDLVYFKEKDNTIVELSPVSISRTTDDKPMGKRFPTIMVNGKEESNVSLRSCSHTCTEDCDECPNLCEKVKDYFKPHPEGLCPACHLFGTTYYKSRLSVGMAWLENDPAWYLKGDTNEKGGMLTLPLLETPRPTWSMPTKAAEIPGRKFYVHHPWSVDEIKNRQTPSHKETIKRTENNRSIEPLEKGNSFTFEINFNHLRDWELGLLLYSIELEEQLAHKLGMAKAFGMGSVMIDIEEVVIKDPTNEMTKEEFIHKGFQKLGIDNMKSDNLSQHPHIKQLREILWFPDNLSVKVKYPELESKKDSKIPAYTDFVREIDPETGRKNPKFQRLNYRLNILQNPWQPWHIDL